MSNLDLHPDRYPPQTGTRYKSESILDPGNGCPVYSGYPPQNYCSGYSRTDFPGTVNGYLEGHCDDCTPQKAVIANSVDCGWVSEVQKTLDIWYQVQSILSQKHNTSGRHKTYWSPLLTTWYMVRLVYTA